MLLQCEIMLYYRNQQQHNRYTGNGQYVSFHPGMSGWNQKSSQSVTVEYQHVFDKKWVPMAETQGVYSGYISLKRYNELDHKHSQLRKNMVICR